ncbi:MAG: non-heme iron oxygenase ferredoxin subunit [Candidatus Micrarchaeia archaeon]
MKKIAKLNEIPENGCKVFEVDGRKIAVYNISGKIYATDAECTHMKGPLCKGRTIIEEGKPYVQCPWHGAVFDLETGQPMSGPAKSPVKVYKIKIEQEEIYLE